jgi:solute:Na+ symporter, SSS family
VTQLAIIGGYLILLLLVGALAGRLSRGTSGDYMLASHTIGPVLLTLSLFGTAMTAFALVGSTAESYKQGIGVYGLLASSSAILHPLCFFLLGVKLWQWGQRYGYRTQVQFFRDRLGSDRIGLVLFPVLVGMVIPYLLIGVMSAGLFINVITRGEVVDGQVQGGTFAAGTFPGFFEQGVIDPETGQRNGFASETGSRGGVPRHIASLAICGIVLGYVFFGGMRGTAWANAFQTTVFLLLGGVMFVLLARQLGGQESLFDNFRALGESIPPSHRSRELMSPTKFLSYMLVPLSIGMFPHIFQHWLTARSAATFKLPIVMHPIFLLILWAPCVLLGAWAAGVPLPPFVASHPNELLPFLVKSTGSQVLMGLLTAGVLAAIMSSLDSQFLCLGTMFTEDIFVHYGGEQRFGERAKVWIARGFIVLIVAITYLLSLFDPRQVFTLGVWCFSGFSSLFPLVVAAIYWRGLTKWGAYASILTAIVLWFWLFHASGYAREDTYAFDLKLGSWSLELMPIVPMVFGSALSLVVVSLATPKLSPERLARFFSPRG